MQVGIIGDASRAVAWEKHLRPLAIVKEVVVAPTLSDLGNIETCIILDDSGANLDILNEAIRHGIHSYLVSRLPTDRAQLEKVYHTSQEADVRVQFSHWPSLSPSTQWMHQHLPKPRFIQSIKESSTIQFPEGKDQFHHHWVDEFAFITKWMDTHTHRLDANLIALQDTESGIQINVHYDNGASASIFYLATGHEVSHRRILSDSSIMIDLDVTTQKTRLMRLSQESHLTIEKKEFDASRAVELSIMLFLKAIQLKTETAFTPYDALRTSSGVEKIFRLLN